MRAMRFLNEHPQSDFARVDIFSADSNPNRLWRAWALQPVLLAMLSPFQQCLHTCLNAERTPAALRWAIRFTSTCSKCANASLYKKAARVHQSHAGSASNRTRTKTHVHMHTRTHTCTHTCTRTCTCTYVCSDLRLAAARYAHDMQNWLTAFPCLGVEMNGTRLLQLVVCFSMGIFNRFIAFSQNQGAEQLKKELADFGIEKMVHRGKIANFLLEELQKSAQERA